MTAEPWKKLYGAFDPLRPVLGAEAVEKLYVERASPLRDRVRVLLDIQGPTRFLFAGARGSGKSTELAQLALQMPEADHATVLLRLEESFDRPWANLSAGQVMFLVGAAAYQAVGLNDSALLERLEDAHSGLVKGADASSALDWTKLLEGLAVFVGGIAGGPVGAAAAKGVALASHALSGKVTLPGRGRTLSPDDTRIRVLCDVLNEVTERARQATGKQLLVLVDGLDKEVDPARIRELFGSGVLASPAVGGLDLVAACPISAMFEVEHTDLRGFTAERLDLFDVLSLDEERRRDALTRMFDVLERRIRYAGLTPERVLPGGGRIGEVEARVLGMTGGVLRDLMLVVRRAIVHAVMEERDPEQDGLSAQDLDAGIRGQREDYLRRVDLDDEELLRRTWLEGNRPGGNRAKLLFNRNIILAYRNGSEPWYRPHPMVVGRLRRRFSELPDDSYR